MRRAMLWLLLSCLLIPTAAAADTVINGVGLIDFMHKPNFKVGDWVRYRLQGKTDKGQPIDQRVTLLIAGEERFWGDDCFWVETSTQDVGKPAVIAIASLLSYSVFTDSLPQVRMKMYVRKQITDVNEEGQGVEFLVRQGINALRDRATHGAQIPWSVDSLGSDTVSTPAGFYACDKLRYREGIAETADRTDSTVRTEYLEARTVYMNHKIPITHIAREETETTAKRTEWAVGHSDAPSAPALIARAFGDARLEAYGTGMTASLVPENVRRSIREQEMAASRPATRRRGKR